jgi:hypothetical protein
MREGFRRVFVLLRGCVSFLNHAAEQFRLGSGSGRRQLPHHHGLYNDPRLFTCQLPAAVAAQRLDCRCSATELSLRAARDSPQITGSVSGNVLRSGLGSETAGQVQVSGQGVPETQPDKSISRPGFFSHAGFAMEEGQERYCSPGEERYIIDDDDIRTHRRIPQSSVMPHRTTARAVNPPHNRTCGTCGKRAVGGFFF